jgi:hypothetical protein
LIDPGIGNFPIFDSVTLTNLPTRLIASCRVGVVVGSSIAGKLFSFLYLIQVRARYGSAVLKYDTIHSDELNPSITLSTQFKVRGAK